MRRIIALVGGVAAAIAGTAAGGLIKPENGSLAGQVAAPRLETAVAGPRDRLDVTEDPGAQAYGEEVPDYVIGTDWLAPPFEEDTTEREETLIAPAPLVAAAPPAPAPRARPAPQAAVARLAEPLQKAPPVPALAADAPPKAPPIF